MREQCTIAFSRDVLRGIDLMLFNVNINAIFLPSLFSFRFSIYMPYCSTGILSFMDITKHKFKGTSLPEVLKKGSFLSLPEFLTKSWLFYLLFCKADCVENVTKDVPNNKLCTYHANIEPHLWRKRFCCFPPFWAAGHLLLPSCRQRLAFLTMEWACMLQRKSMELCSIACLGRLARLSCMCWTEVFIISVKLKLRVLWLGGTLV